VWEPAAGAGAVSDVLRAHGYDVVATDIRPRAPGIAAADFFAVCRSGFDIVTNPPFRLLVPFTLRGFELCHRKMALVMPVSGLNSSRRYQALWSRLPVSRIYLAPRYQVVRSARGLIGSQFTHIWAVFDKGHDGPPIFKWFPDVIYRSK
jgi:hypothetical protein